jgi:hypothetical protein
MPSHAVGLHQLTCRRDVISSSRDNYCRRNPLHAITQAVYALTNSYGPDADE